MATTAIETEPPRRIFVYRHSVLVRITHWINVLCILFLVMSGLQIFNAHPALYWGEQSHFDDPLLKMSARNNAEGQPVGETTIFGATFDTSGVLGMSYVGDRPQARGFPSWLTVPSYQDLATGRRWHFFFAWLFFINGAVYLIASFLSRHVWRDLVPTWTQLRGLGRSIIDHARLRFHHTKEYNVLQRVTYLIMVIAVLPAIVLSGLTMSPALDAAFPWLVELFGGRQSARTIHFICMLLIVLFVLVHVIMVMISGLWNNIRSMITGHYAVEEKGHE
jgi:thiosulfate reductase cytochrome b subunit